MIKLENALTEAEHKRPPGARNATAMLIARLSHACPPPARPPAACKPVQSLAGC